MAAAITLLFVILGETAEQVSTGYSVEMAQGPKIAPKFNAMDYATTGSVGATKIVIGPCDARKP